MPFAGARNPLDITGQVSQIPDAFRETLGLMAADGTCDLIVNFLSAAGLSPNGLQNAEDIVAVRAERPEIPHYIVTLASPDFRAKLEAAGCPIFEDPNRAVHAAAALAADRRGLRPRRPARRRGPAPRARGPRGLHRTAGAELLLARRACP